MLARLGAFLRDERGSAAVEYGLLAALITLAIVASVVVVGQSVVRIFGTLGDEMAKIQ
ncbi:Flp family type IVb pilin [Chelatococcus sp. SYSU_G07232]|uniref:Flp family type IVb pilin n=1 Tax=Chelatococcus albus TaxID=3047466 RepID=A0ABT7AMI8_9HYPH|nr:Flp family type IVb pilin [Chelatococcus sp. SYSU_G07232]MDJ1160014.1 Flp family type IVb pilin [Chelatococcus sp. SYSU_G07232]